MNELSAKQIGKEYMEKKPENRQEVKESYKKLARINKYLFEQIPVNVEFVQEDPYTPENSSSPSYELMCEDIERNDNMKIFAGGSEPEYLNHRQNIIGRAVHDFYGHYLFQCPFTLEGEFRKWHNMREFYPEDVVQLLFSEVVCQTCEVIYLGGFSEKFVQNPVYPKPEWIEYFNDKYL